MFYKEDLYSVKERWIRVVFLDAYYRVSIIQRAIIGVYRYICCGYRVITGGVILRIKSTDYWGGGLCDYRYDYKITIDINYEIIMNIQVCFELGDVNKVCELVNVNIVEFQSLKQ